MDREDVLFKLLGELIAEARKRNEIEEQKRVELKRIRIQIEGVASEYVGRAGG